MRSVVVHELEMWMEPSDLCPQLPGLFPLTLTAVDGAPVMTKLLISYGRLDVVIMREPIVSSYRASSRYNYMVVNWQLWSVKSRVAVPAVSSSMSSSYTDMLGKNRRRATKPRGPMTPPSPPPPR